MLTFSSCSSPTLSSYDLLTGRTLAGGNAPQAISYKLSITCLLSFLLIYFSFVSFFVLFWIELLFRPIQWAQKFLKLLKANQNRRYSLIQTDHIITPTCHNLITELWLQAGYHQTIVLCIPSSVQIYKTFRRESLGTPSQRIEQILWFTCQSLSQLIQLPTNYHCLPKIGS